MRSLLLKSRDELRDEFAALGTTRDLAELLEIKFSLLIYYARKKRVSARYRYFQIPKKTGGNRTIHAPEPTQRLIQQKLLQVLEAVYEPRSSAQGFVPKRSFITNAGKHVGKRLVFNLDLLDFFGSINFGRVLGLFKAWPYDLPHDVAVLLAQVVCANNFLPQGAPTSPIVSNMICRRLDSNLQRLARTHGCVYTRYCDDITFSTHKAQISTDICEVGPSGIAVGGRLSGILRRNGFEVNTAKTWLYSRAERQEVTGLVTNRKVNVNRHFVRQVRAMLHSWRKHGVDKSASHFFEKYDRKGRTPEGDRQERVFQHVVRGKIDHIGAVRGRSDPLYQRLLYSYHKLSGTESDRALPPDIKAIFDTLWVLRSVDANGTGFMLRDVGIVTCNHVLEAAGGWRNLSAYRYDRPTEAHPIRVLARHPTKDLAVLEIEDIDMPLPGLVRGQSNALKQLDQVVIGGFPNYRLGEEPLLVQANVSGMRTYDGIQRFLVNMPLYPGTSGGPVMYRDTVVGVASTGGRNTFQAQTTENHAAIRIEELPLTDVTGG